MFAPYHEPPRDDIGGKLKQTTNYSFEHGFHVTRNCRVEAIHFPNLSVSRMDDASAAANGVSKLLGIEYS